MTAEGITGGDPTKLDLAGGTLTGPLVLAGAPTADLGAATKAYVDGTSGAGGVPSTTVAAETAYGVVPAAGSSGSYSRGDHTHGTPTAPTAVSVGAAATVHNHDAAYSPVGHTHGSSGPTHVDTGLITSGAISCVVGTFTQIGTDLTIAAAIGDVLSVEIEALVDTAGGDLVIDAATRVAGANANWFGSGSTANNYPGGVPNWFIATGRFDSPKGSRRYVVKAGDVSAGSVTVRVYGQGDGSARSVLASTSWPLRITLTNRGPSS